ncbi:MAG: sulfite exporter TauE/SafE family protein [Treponema sp.]|nr:sulfite exporter TauE/SafE family protein [Treponema sp.]
MEIIYGMVIVAVSGFVQGVTGFGLSIAAIPFLILLFPLREIVPSIAVLAIITNCLVLIPARREVKFKKFRIMVLMSVLFTPLGILSLQHFNQYYLKLIFGVLITFFSLMLIFKKTFSMKNEKAGYTITGIISGVLNGSLSISGPPVVLLLSNQGIEKETFRANISLYFFILNVITIAIFLINGMLNMVIFERLIFFMPALFVGALLGIKISKKVKNETFGKLVLVLLIFSGVWTTISTLSNLII